MKRVNVATLTLPVCTSASSAFPGVAKGTSCNQSSFKAGKGSFLYIGPGAKGQGFKAMFKLDRSIPQAQELADDAPERFEVGPNGWVTARFSAEKPLQKSIWEKWLKESHDLQCGPGSKAPAATKSAAKKSTAKRTAEKKPAAKKAAGARKKAGRSR